MFVEQRHPGKGKEDLAHIPCIRSRHDIRGDVRCRMEPGWADNRSKTPRPVCAMADFGD